MGLIEILTSMRHAETMIMPYGAGVIHMSDPCTMSWRIHVEIAMEWNSTNKESWSGRSGSAKVTEICPNLTPVWV